MTEAAAEIQNNASPKANSPVATTALFPIRTASRVPTMAATAIEIATGKILRPVPNAVYPRTNWKYCVTRNVNPARVKNAIMIEPLAAVNRKFLNRVTSSIGRAVRDSTRTNATMTASPIAAAPRVFPETQPHVGAWMMLSTIRPIPTVESNTPLQSIGGVEGSREVGTANPTSIATTAATGTMNRNTLPHQ